MRLYPQARSPFPLASRSGAFIVGAAFWLAPGAAAQFDEVYELSVSSLEAFDLLPGDLDGDGDLDLVVVSREPGSTLVLENDGSGGYRVLQRLTQVVEDVAGASLFDLDGDGVPDLLLFCQLPSLMKWMRGTGDGKFAPQVQLGGVPTPTAIDTVDLDGDGLEDLAFSTSAGQRWMRNLGGGSFAPNVVIGELFRNVADFAHGDVDGDGDIDLVTLDWSNDAVSLHENLGGATFGAATTIATASADGWSVSLIDVDVDGDLDVVTCWELANYVGLALNTGTGMFAPEVPLFVGANRPTEVVAIDANLDGLTDLVFSKNGDGGGVDLALATAPGVFGASPVPLGPESPYAEVLIKAEVDGDGMLDVLVASSEGNVFYYPGTAQSPYFGTSREATAALLGVSDSSVGDFDGDGDLDIVASAYNGDIVRAYTNEGGGTFGEGRVAVDGVEKPASIELGDLNGDGFLDLLVTGSYPASIQYSVGAQDGTFATPTVIDTLGSVNFADATLGDLDGDGDSDVLVAVYQGDLRWYAQLDAGMFSAAQIIDPNPRLPFALQVEDIDGDGLSDVAAVCWNEQMFRWWRNEGGGVFSSAVSMTPYIDMPTDGALGDMDGDGDLDAIWCNGTAYWAPNQGALGFGAPVQLPGSAGRCSVLRAFDADLDGDLDLALLLPGPFSPVPMFLEALGGGQFSSPVPLNPRLKSSSAVFPGDLDDDGDQDLVFLQGGNNRAFIALGDAVGTIGDTVCGPGVTNSSGLDGRITARGDLSVSANSATIYADRIPPGSFGYLLTSQTLIPASPVVGSAGLICLGGAVGRFVGPGQVQQASAAGRIQQVLDVAALPTPSGLVSAMAGETWSFQAWHRDSAPAGTTSNFTNVVSLGWN